MVLGAIRKRYSMTRNLCDFASLSLRAISLLTNNIIELLMKLQSARQGLFIDFFFLEVKIMIGVCSPLRLGSCKRG